MKELYKAIAGFQQEVPILHKSNKASFKSKKTGYETSYSFIGIDSIIEQINPIMKKHNLGFAQPLEGNGIKTIVFHTESGDSIESFVEIPDSELMGQNKFQSIGSAITYFRRYSLSAMLGLITDVDLDACGDQKTSNGIEDIRIDKYADGEELELQLKKAMISISKRIEPNAPATLEDFDNLTLEALKDDFQSYRDQENDFNAKKWIDDQSKKPKKSGSKEALTKLWDEAVKRGFATPYVREVFAKKGEEFK